MKIIVDGMGGDHAPKEIVKGAAAASRFFKEKEEIVLVGDEAQIAKLLEKHDHAKDRVSVVHASEVITGEDKPVKAIRAKRDSSLVRALELVRDGGGDVLISAGNSGALMTGALLVLGRIEGIDRPALGAPYPLAIKDTIGLLIDAGANSECKPQALLQFAAMGNIYAEKVLGVKRPIVGLINMGTEPEKGGNTLRETYKLLQAAADRDIFSFVGNIEARDIPYGVADVLVGDGMTGNTVLKLTEGLGMAIMTMLGQKLTSSTGAKIGAMLVLPKIRELKALFDYSEYGGAPVLGVKHPVIKIHGSSDWKTVQNAILRAVPFVAEDVVGHIEEQLGKIELG
ncbi:MAG: phosphate acyltransferase PlsX [Clostridiales Family XIII bacterium]|jgi:glycerol-3-phosphate acyltransferase PlsX|nr:phosphate acyltransferase PlsX [Clostridiales Family XIII bacterium]